MFMMGFLIMLFGIIVAGMPSFLPPETIPAGGGILLFVIGGILAIMGYMIVWMKAGKTGADLLITPERPGEVIWFYIHKDGNIELFKTNKHFENTIKNPTTGGLVYDQAPLYHIAQHTARIVLDNVGSTVDARKLIYAKYLKSKGIKNIRALRKKAKEDDQLE